MSEQNNRDYWKKNNPVKKHYTNRELKIMGLRNVALSRVNSALKNGTLTKTDCCEVCFRDDARLVAHHWKGYKDAFDVWWVCHKCNSNLKGEKFHSGFITLEVARGHIKSLYAEKALINGLYVAIEGAGGRRRTYCEVCGSWGYIRSMNFVPADVGTNQCICDACSIRSGMGMIGGYDG